jgi:hypothetical protein
MAMALDMVWSQRMARHNRLAQGGPFWSLPLVSLWMLYPPRTDLLVTLWHQFNGKLFAQALPTSLQQQDAIEVLQHKP